MCFHHLSPVAFDKGSFYSPVVVQIGFERNSYTVREGDKSVTVCAKVLAGTTTVPVSVTLVTADIKSAQGMYVYIYLTVAFVIWFAVYKLLTWFRMGYGITVYPLRLDYCSNWRLGPRVGYLAIPWNSTICTCKITKSRMKHSKASFQLNEQISPHHVVYQARPISLTHYKLGAGCREKPESGLADVFSMRDVLTYPSLLRDFS